MIKREDIRIRDPFILTDTEAGCYYMYGTTALGDSSLAAGNTFSVYKTRDLENFEEPRVVVDGAKWGLWADRDFWAPEVHRYGGKYYLFGSCTAEGGCRATHIFVSDTPDGAFRPVSPAPATPVDWLSLDGTLWVEGGVPYMVFCHEWIQVGDGEICALPLAADLSAPAGEPILLFHATDNPDVEIAHSKEIDGYITDGPFLFREEGKLRMIWSSRAGGHYAVLLAESESGSVLGPWKHFGNRFAFDGGHAMLFYTLEGVRMISLHSPNAAGKERAVFFPF